MRSSFTTISGSIFVRARRVEVEGVVLLIEILRAVGRSFISCLHSEAPRGDIFHRIPSMWFCLASSSWSGHSNVAQHQVIWALRQLSPPVVRISACDLSTVAHRLASHNIRGLALTLDVPSELAYCDSIAARALVRSEPFSTDAAT